MRCDPAAPAGKDCSSKGVAIGVAMRFAHEVSGAGPQSGRFNLRSEA